MVDELTQNNFYQATAAYLTRSLLQKTVNIVGFQERNNGTMLRTIHYFEETHMDDVVVSLEKKLPLISCKV